MPYIIALLALIATAFAVFNGGIAGMMVQAASEPTDGDNVGKENAPILNGHIVATDVTTWPSGDRIWDVCRAIAHAEGYNVAGSNPAVLNNPGDISDGSSVYGFESHSGSSITKFPDAPTGWQWLYTKIENAANGLSSVYDPSMSWREIGSVYAPPNAETWASNVANNLGVDSDSSLGDYITNGA